MKRLGLVFGVLVIFSLACGSTTPSRTSSNSSSVSGSSGKRAVRYEITGNGVSAVSLTFQNDSGGTDQGDFKVPFRKSYSFERGDFLYISAQIIKPTSNAGSITCHIYVDNEDVYHANASGFASIATCSGSAP